MATVYEAAHTVLPRRAALKIMHRELLHQPGMATRLVQEAAILEDLRHPGVVRVFDCNVLSDHRPWIAMELVEGETLASRLHRAGRLPALEVATLLCNVADVLAAVHVAGVVHRDLKPDNLLCTPGNHDYPLRVLDWGIARLASRGRLTIDGLTPGTPIYMSPEQAAGHHIAAPCDIYSLGVIAYEALTGEPPFEGRTLAEIVCMHLTREPVPLRDRCDAPPGLCELVTRMLDKNPERRPVALELRQLARAVALELSAADDPPAPVRDEPTTPWSLRPAYVVPENELGVVESEVLEYEQTEMLPAVRKPRWTPELGDLPNAWPAGQTRRGQIGPRSPRDQVAGEIISHDKLR